MFGCQFQQRQAHPFLDFILCVQALKIKKLKHKDYLQSSLWEKEFGSYMGRSN